MPMPTLSDLLPALSEPSATAVIPELHAARGVELEFLIGAPVWADLLRDLTVFVEYWTDVPFGKQVPALNTVSRATIPITSLSTRTKNVLGREGIVFWQSLLSCTPRDLADMRNSGRMAQTEIVGLCLEAGANLLVCPDSSSARTSACETAGGAKPDGPLLPSQMSGAELDLRLIASWAYRVVGAAQVRDILKPRLPLGVMRVIPQDINDAWARLAEMPLTEFADLETSDGSLDQIKLRVFSRMDSVEEIILRRRILAMNSTSTLDELGIAVGLTRERVRQIQVKTKDRLAEALAEDGSRLMVWQGSALRAMIGSMWPIDEDEYLKFIRTAIGRPWETDDDTVALLHWAAGGYRILGQWLCASGTIPPDTGLVLRFADEAGVVDVEALKQDLRSAGLRDAVLERWLTDTGQTRILDGQTILWAGSVADKCAAVLGARGRPADTDWLVNAISEGHSVRSTRNRLFEDPRFVRTSKSLWGLRSWGMEEYTGIADELKQRIEEQGGFAKLSDLARELADAFGVKESSVRVYAEAPMFILEAGILRLRGADEPYPIDREVARARGCYVADGKVSYLLAVDKDAIRGSGRSCPEQLAAALGVIPGSPKEFAHDLGRLLVTWVETSGLGPSLGSTRSLVESLGAGSGDWLRLDFELNSSTVSATKVVGEAEATAEALRRAEDLTGLVLTGHSGRAVVARALDVPVTDVIGVLTRRGDAELALLLPEEAPDADLSDALSDLAAAIGDLES